MSPTPWSPREADLVAPDPGGLNRALDRAAAEHLRDVAPHLAPCLTCQAGLCAEHGPTVTATTTGARAAGAIYVFYEGCEDRAYTVEVRPDGPVLTDSTGATFARVSTAAPAPPAEATGEMSREAYERDLRIVYANDGHLPPEVTHAAARLFAHDAALRTRAREAEERAEKTTEHLLNRVAKAVRRGDELERERDEAREQRDLATAAVTATEAKCASLGASLAAANARAEEAERTVEAFQAAALLGPDSDGITHEMVEREITTLRASLDTERAARVAAEAERDAREAQRAACYSDLTATRARLAAAEAELRRIRTMVGGTGELADDVHRAGVLLREYHEGRYAALRERCKALEEAGDALSACLWHVAGDQPSVVRLRDEWAAAKGAKP